MNKNQGEAFFLNYLQNREKISGIEKGNDFKITVFVGLYNAVPFIDEVLNSLKCQQEKNFAIVVVDNNSTDGTWEYVQKWKHEFNGRITLIRNPVNIGGTANLYFALDEIETEWFTQFHQDDCYLDNHLSTIVKSLESIGENVIGISTEMGSISEDGSKLPMKSRSTWLIENKSRPEIFIANVFVHSIYWPSSAFKKLTYKSIYAPWHSASFPDTEILLRLCAVGDFVILPKRTMFYRENPASESHSLTTKESKLGAGLGLLRIFESQEFIEILGLCEPALLSSFFSKLRQGIELRVENPEIAQLVYVFALEKANMIFDYSNFTVLNKLLDFYQDIDATRTASLLEILVNKNNSHSESGLRVTARKNNDKLSISSQNTESQTRTLPFRSIRRATIKIIQFLPTTLQIIVMKIILRLRICLNSKHSWNFKLKKDS